MTRFDVVVIGGGRARLRDRGAGRRHARERLPARGGRRRRRGREQGQRGHRGLLLRRARHARDRPDQPRQPRLGGAVRAGSTCRTGGSARSCSRVDEAEEAKLPGIAAEARACGVRAELIGGDRARELEPLVAPACRAAVHLPDEGIVDPMRLTVAFARLAATNGCDVRRGVPVTALEREDGGRTRVVTPQGALRARYVVNAAGAAAGDVSRLAGGEPFAVWPRKGQYVLLDREFGRRLRAIVFSTQLPDTKGVQRRPDDARHLPARPDGRRPRRPVRHGDRRARRSPACGPAPRGSSPPRPAPRRSRSSPRTGRRATSRARAARRRRRTGCCTRRAARPACRSRPPPPSTRSRCCATRGSTRPTAPARCAALPAVPRLRTAPRAGAPDGGRPRLRAGRLRLRAGQRRRDRRRAARPGRRALGRRAAQAHRRGLRPLPGRDVPGRAHLPVRDGDRRRPGRRAAHRRGERGGVTVLVVGAGAAGLGAATALAGARRGRARRPRPGAGRRRGPRARGRAAPASRRPSAPASTFALGATATRWEDGRLLVCAPGAIRWRAAATLVFAGGMRPATAAELGLAGDRPAGVLAGAVARHLLETGSPAVAPRRRRRRRRRRGRRRAADPRGRRQRDRGRGVAGGPPGRTARSRAGAPSR